MDLMKIFRRQKSVGKKGKNADSVSTEKESRVAATKACDLNLNKSEKGTKSWAKSVRRSLRKKSFQSNSCDDILRGSAAASSVQNELSDLGQSPKRWSYSPEHTAAGSNIYRSKESQSLLRRRHTEGLLKSDGNRPSSYSGNNGTMSERPTLYANDMHRDGCLALSSPQTIADARLDPQFCQSRLPTNSCLAGVGSLDAGSCDRSYVTPIGPDLQPHATHFLHTEESALERENEISDLKHCDRALNQEQEPCFPQPSNDVDYTYEFVENPDENKADGDSSWGSNEFDSDSEDDASAYDDVLVEEGLDRVQSGKGFFKRNRELSKDITDGMRKLKFLQRRGPLWKKNAKVLSDEDPSTFVDVRISQERHPGPRLKPPPMDLLPYQSRRRNIIQTIISSESSYIDSLERLEINYRKSLMDSRPAVISLELVERIFYKIADILQCHQLFQIALTAAVNDWDNHEKIGDTFVASFSKAMVLECYSSYINNFTTAMELVRKTCKQRPQFLTFLRERQEESQNRLNLYGLMLKPVQRFPQFIMLVQDLLKNTPSDHEDYLPVQLALTELETLAENLNRRRAEDEERMEMLRLLDSSNIKLLSNLTKDGRVRRLLKQGFIRELTHNDEGVVEKDKDCLLVLTNDMLLTCSCSNRRQQVKSTMSTYRDLYKLKWNTTLDLLSIVDQQDFLFSLEQTKLKSDLATLKSLDDLIRKLHHPLPELSAEQVQFHISTLEEKLDNSKQNMTENAFSIQFRQKSGECKRTLVMPDSHQRNDWLDCIINARLANDDRNLRCWFSADGSDAEQLWKPPLFLESFECADNHKSLQVQCAYAFMPSCHITLFWLACSASTVVATVNVYRIINEKTEKVHTVQVESSVQCMEHWCLGQDSSSVWLGMECGSLIEFDAGSTYAKLCEVTMPTMSTVMIMKAFEKHLYAGLLDGSLVMYTRPEGHKGLVQVQSITVGSGPLNCLSLLKGKLWGTSGNDIVTISLDDFRIESTRTIHTEEPMTVSHVVQVGSGFWVAFCDTCNLRLYHLDTLKLLQDLSLSRPIRDFSQGLQSRTPEHCSITAMWSAYSQLLVGTSNGLVLTMPLPKLPGSVPKITGPCLICHHMLSGPIHFLRAPTLPSLQPCDSTPNLAVGERENDTPPDIPERSPIKPSIGHGEAIGFSHKRTSSEGLLNVSELSHAKQMKKRFSSVEPYVNQNQTFREEVRRPPPALPPKPNTAKEKGPVTEKMLEDVFVMDNSDLKHTPGSIQKKEMHWDGSKSRNFPVLLACGEGYRYNSADGDLSEEYFAHKATSVLSWKIVL